MTNGEKIQQDFACEVCEPIIEDDIIHVIFADKKDSAIGFDWSWWNAEYEESTTKNDLGVDYISKQEVVGLMMHIWGKNHSGDDAMQECIDAIREMPSVTSQEPQSFKWCDTCKEYDQEKHCCHRWSKVIRDTVEEMKQEQEPILDKIFCMVHPLSIMSTPELEHKAIMQIAEMLEPICFQESEG